MKQNARTAVHALIFPFAFFLFWQGESCQNKKSDVSANRKSEVVTVPAKQNENRETAKQDDKNANVAPAASPDEQSSSIAKGLWGGAHISLSAGEDGGAEVEYDCGHGRIEKITLAADGSFAARGSHVSERGGPVRVGGESAAGQPARFSGQVTDKRMTLTVTLDKSGESLGTFELVHGQTPRLTKCL